MSVFGSIMSKVFGHGGSASAQPAAMSGTQPATAGAGSTGEDPSTPSQPGAPPNQGAASQGVDVAAVLTDMASKSPQQMNWRQSIVDLMKLLGLDSSLDNRKQLAQELGYTGDTNDSATMNVWLHKQVMQKLADNGGQVPAELRS